VCSFILSLNRSPLPPILYFEPSPRQPLSIGRDDNVGETLKRQPLRIVAIDYGMARIGIALSDESQMIAFPLSVMTTERRMEQTVVKLVEVLLRHQQEHRYALKSIVIGLPLLLSGKAGLLVDEVKCFAALLEQAFSVPLVLWDERLTTVQAERAMREGGMSRKKRSKVIDSVTAVILLQSYLDRQRMQQD
jgi:putative Holliday junction resolvase